ncbi:hypothetical protein QKW35_05615 [Pontibacterium granulatum]|uniref:hypothetical protein n=1 Tax=Pontibacterium granulatum TaxID=2036029 RepID=UPI00249A8F0A|nr:hypothetical protein [Pontibacterium granulatum]MDI3323845.1 hypothetical protein [Pontibacterium granulatum]
MKTLLEHLGWNSSHLDKSGSYACIDTDPASLEILFKSHKDATAQSAAVLSSFIETGDILQFSKALQFQKMEARLGLNPLLWVFWIFEQVYSLVKSDYKRLNIMELSLEGFSSNPSNKIEDFPFDKPLKVFFIIANHNTARMFGKNIGIVLQDTEKDELWGMNFDAFCNVSLIQIEKSVTDS